jgi:N-acetylmuramoyl-L-alanine amidase
MLKISLSAGHGKNTAGKRTCDGMHEWEFNAAVVTKMIAKLSHYKDVAVKRLDDPTGVRDIPLKERADASNNFGANFHLDVHANASGDGVHWNNANGIETFCYKMLGESYEIAKRLQDSLVKATGLLDRGVKDGEDLYMINHPKAPSCLVECGFMTNEKEASLLKSDAYREVVAQALVRAIVDHFKLVAAIPQPAPQPAAKTVYKVQVGAFASRDNAEALQKSLKDKGFDAVIVAN